MTQETMTEELANHQHQLVVMDMDSTLIKQEAIDLLGHAVGKGEEMSQITARAMAGEMDFEEAIKERVEMLAGLEVEQLEKIRTQLTLTPGAEIFFKTIKAFGYKTGLVSGGFSYFVEPLSKELDIDHTLSNVLEHKHGKITGKLLPPIIDRAAKAQFLIDIAAEQDIPLEKTVAIGGRSQRCRHACRCRTGHSFLRPPQPPGKSRHLHQHS